MFVNFYKSFALAIAISGVSAVHLETEEDTALAGSYPDDFSYGLAEIYNENKPAVAPTGSPMSADVKNLVEQDKKRLSRQEFMANLRKKRERERARERRRPRRRSRKRKRGPSKPMTPA